jgi:hypothetical protein
MPATLIARANERRQREGEGARVNTIKDPDKLPAEGLSGVNYVVEARVNVPIVYAFSGECFGRSNLGSPSAHVALEMLAQQVMSGGVKQAATTRCRKEDCYGVYGVQLVAGKDGGESEGGEGREGQKDQGSRVP